VLVTRTSEGTVSELGLTLYQLRLARGLSLRTLARQVGMASHGGLADYECGRRIPPEDVIHTYERVLGIGDHRLVRLREQALRDRAAAKTAQRVPDAPPDEHTARTPPAQLPCGVADFTGGHPDAQVYCDLRGVHAPADPAEVLAIEVQRSSASAGESPSRVNSTV
jgi:transcriptional regulator with XRE-family HTH domain